MTNKPEPVSVEPVAEVEESYTGMHSDGMYRAVVVSHERLSVGAELYLHAAKAPSVEPVGDVVLTGYGVTASPDVAVRWRFGPNKPKAGDTIFTAAQLEAEKTRAVNEALEKAAMVLENLVYDLGDTLRRPAADRKLCAMAVRAMKGKQT